MEIIQTILTAFASIIVLFILSKLMGNREISQLTVFDYINGITTGSIAAEMATSEFTDIKKPLVAMIVYGLTVTLISILTNKSIKCRRFFTGVPNILFEDGIIYEKNLKKAKMDIGEFLSQCRISGYFDLSNAKTILLEPNGKLSFIPIVNSSNDPSSNAATSTQDYLLANIIIDGKIMSENLKHAGKNEKWLQKQLSQHNISDPSTVLLATCDINNTIKIYTKNDFTDTKDILE